MKRQPTEWKKIFANDATDRAQFQKYTTAHTTQQQQQQYQLNQKMGRRPKQIFLQRRHTDGQEAHEKMFNIGDNQRNENQNYNEISPHTSQNGYHQKIHKQ